MTETGDESDHDLLGQLALLESVQMVPCSPGCLSPRQQEQALGDVPFPSSRR